MTNDYDCPVLTETDAINVAYELAEGFAVGAAERDRARELPYQEMDLLSASGLLALTVPRSYGGADLPASTVADVIRILAAADPNIAQIPHSHFVYVNLLRLGGSEKQCRDYFGQLLRGARIANAQAERNGPTAAASIISRFIPTSGPASDWCAAAPAPHWSAATRKSPTSSSSTTPTASTSSFSPVIRIWKRRTTSPKESCRYFGPKVLQPNDQ